ncbi:MAG: hypothetical protein ACFBQW_03070 [Sphingomonadaceae bacterium]
MGEGDKTTDEMLLVAAAQAVLASLRGPLEGNQLSGPALASLRLLETALEPYEERNPQGGA